MTIICTIPTCKNYSVEGLNLCHKHYAVAKQLAEKEQHDPTIK